MREMYPVIGAAVVYALAVYLAGVFVLQQFANSADEFDYLYQAHTFASGKVSNDAHPMQEFLSPFFIKEHKGKVFSIFPPGWPVFLTFGVWIENPWIVNPILAGFTLIVLYRISRYFMNPTFSWLTVGLWTLSPMVILNSASLYSHSCCSFFILLSMLFLIRCDRQFHAVDGLLAGVCMALSFCTRELTAVAVLLLPVLVVMYVSPNRLRFLLCAAMGIFPVALLYGWYCAQLTGYWFYPPRYLLLDEYLGFGWREIRLFDYTERQYHGPLDAVRITVANGWRLFHWTIFMFPLFSMGGLYFYRTHRWMVVFLLSSLLLIAAYSLYPSEGGSQYGARFYYEALPLLAVIAGYMVQRIWMDWKPVPAGTTYRSWHLKTKAYPGLLGIMLLVLFGYPYTHIPNVYESVYQRRDLFRQIAHKDLNHALVFVNSPSGDMTHGDLIRNLPDYRNALVIYAWDLAGRNRELVKHFPQRNVYRYTRHESGRFAVLVPHKL